MDGLVTVTFTVDREDVATKANLLDNLQTCWSDNDTIAVYDGVEARKFGISSIAEDGRATFTGQVAEGATSFKAVYPYSAFVAVRHDTVDFKMPTAQVLSGKQVADPAALVSYAAATNINEPLHFKNLVSLVKVTVPAGTTSVLVKANADAQGVAPKIVNNVSVITTEEGFSSFECAGSETVTLAPAEGALREGSYYIAVAPSTASAGIRCNVVSAEGAAIITSENSAAFARNGIVSLGNVAENEKASFVKLTVGTVEEFRTFLDNASVFPSSAVLKISADLDLGGVDWTCSTERFLGSIDGQNHRIYNYVIKSGEGTANAGDAAVIGRVGAGKATEPYYIKNIVFGSKDYDFATGQGTYDGVSKVTYESLNNGSDTYYYPGAIAYCYAYGTMENLVNFTPVEITSKCTTPHRAGALLGTVKANVTIKDCTNYADLSDATVTCTKAPTVAGIAGALDGANCVVEGCKNYGNITVTGTALSDWGGVVGYCNADGAVLKNCVNAGKLTQNCNIVKATYVGGMGGRFNKPTQMENLLNSGDIELNLGKGAFNVFVGGMCGRVGGGNYVNCDNSGNISMTVNSSTTGLSYVAGCFANTFSAKGVMTDCDNSGDVTASGTNKCAYVGGVDGYNAFELEMRNCTNTGKVKMATTNSAANGGAAGIIMFSNAKSTLDGNINKAEISMGGDTKAKVYLGGISGIWGTVNTHSMTNCVNEGKIIAGSASQSTAASLTNLVVAGGIAGAIYGASMTACTNKGEICTVDGTVANMYAIGGVLGGSNYVAISLDGNVNEGAINVSSAAAESLVGGISGYFSPKVMTNNTNKGNITVTADTKVNVGGLSGLAYNAAPIAPVATLGGAGTNGNVINCAISVNSASEATSGMVLGGNSVTTEYSIATAEAPLTVSGTFNGAAAASTNLLGSSVTGVTVNANIQ